MVADRLCGAVSDPIIRNAQEQRQLAYMAEFLAKRNYKQKPHPPSEPIEEMEPGTFSFRTNVIVGGSRKVNIPIDLVIQPKTRRPNRVPILIEAKSAGDFTNVNKRRKVPLELRAKTPPLRTTR
ncbi:MAG: XamI family restriction endonuclease [Phycisphaerae bacterium]